MDIVCPKNQTVFQQQSLRTRLESARLGWGEGFFSCYSETGYSHTLIHIHHLVFLKMVNLLTTNENIALHSVYYDGLCLI